MFLAREMTLINRWFTSRPIMHFGYSLGFPYRFFKFRDQLVESGPTYELKHCAVEPGCATRLSARRYLMVLAYHSRSKNSCMCSKVARAIPPQPPTPHSP